ncbi:hypothetical protein D3C76_1574940 [compost metagenome]
MLAVIAVVLSTKSPTEPRIAEKAWRTLSIFSSSRDNARCPSCAPRKLASAQLRRLCAWLEIAAIPSLICSMVIDTAPTAPACAVELCATRAEAPTSSSAEAPTDAATPATWRMACWKLSISSLNA